MTSNDANIDLVKIKADIADIIHDIKYLHKVVDALRRDVDSNFDLVKKMGDLNIKSLSTMLDNIYNRIIPLENKVFPGIPRDLKETYKIIGPGEHPESSNPLDRRPPEKP